jgi:hypothetical protein
VIENGFGLDGANALIPFRARADPAMDESHADAEQNIVARVIEGHARHVLDSFRECQPGRESCVISKGSVSS